MIGRMHGAHKKALSVSQGLIPEFERLSLTVPTVLLFRLIVWLTMARLRVPAALELLLQRYGDCK